MVALKSIVKLTFLRSWIAVSLGLPAHAAVIKVDTVDGAKPPAAVVLAPQIPEGAPLDFDFYAVRKHGPPVKEAVEKELAAIERLTAASPTMESVSAEESVLSGNLLLLPSLYAGLDAISAQERVPKKWNGLVNRRQDLIKQAVQSVGRIQIQYLDPDDLGLPGYSEAFIEGTGFVVGTNLVMTNRHVVKRFSHIDKPNYPFKTDERGEYEAVVWIDFAGVYGEPPNLYRVSRVKYVAPEDGPDVAIVEVSPRPEANLEPRLSLQTTPPAARNVGRNLLVCGFPTFNNKGDSRVPNLFRILRVKRLSLGELRGEQFQSNRFRLFHNCTTLGGSSGSPVIDLDSGTVWGLHYSGKISTDANIAEAMWAICAIKDVKQILGNQIPQPPKFEPLPAEKQAVAPKQFTRPVEFVDRGNLLQMPPAEWFRPDSPKYDLVRRAARSVCTLRVETSSRREPESIATGFLVAPNLVMTVSFALQGLVKEIGPRKYGAPVIRCDFDRTVFNHNLAALPVAEIVYLPKDFDVGVALLRIPQFAGMMPGEPLRLAIRPPDDGPSKPVFVVGHPVPDSRVPDEVFRSVFPPPFGVKRVALGSLVPREAEGLWHDCSTSRGDAGAPVVSLATGQVLGIHIGGEYLVANQALPMWRVLEDPLLREVPEIRQLLATEK